MSSILQQGGWVVVAILLTSVMAWVLIVWEWLRLAQQSGGDWRWVDDALDAIEAGQPPNMAMLEGRRFNFVSRLLRLPLASHSKPRRAFHAQVTPHLRSEEIALFRPLRVIAIMAAIMPLLGLLGTVLGMVSTFDALMAGHAAKVDAMAGGISQALITTQLGLVAAMPVMLAHGYLASRARSYIDTSAVMLKRLESVVCYE